MGRNVTAVGAEKKENRRELKKHAATIHCSNTLSLLQRKISNALLYHAYEDLMRVEEHEITVKQLCRLIGYQGNNHAAIKEALKGLISTIIEWNLVDGQTGAENWTASSIIASVSLEGPNCYYAYSPRMKQLLHSPSMFGKIDLVIQSKFRSSYGLALYENCIRYRGLPHTKWFDMDLFKKLMGVPSGMYDVFRDFKRRVLDKAINEVNTYSDLLIAPEYVKEGRKVAKVRFTLKDRAKRTRLGNHQLVPLEHKREISELHQQVMSEFGLSEEQAEQLLREYDSQFVQDKIAVIKASKPFQDGKIDNLAGYLISAVKNNYQMPKKKRAEVVNLQTAKKEIEQAEIRRQIEAIREGYQAYREQAIERAIDDLSGETKRVFMEQFHAYAEPVIAMIIQLQRSKYNRDNVTESPQVKALLRQFAARELDMTSVMPLEDYVTQLSAEQRAVWEKGK